MNLQHDLGKVYPTPPQLPSYYQPYNGVSKRNIFSSQINRLKRTPNARAKEAPVAKREKMSNTKESAKKAIQEADKSLKEAEKAM